MADTASNIDGDITPDVDGTFDGTIDWDTLIASARDVMTSAYAPYSRYPVGAAGLLDDGTVIVGCNVENASYGLTLCAECGLVSALFATGGGRLVAVVSVDSKGNELAPCGRCRQLLFEHGGPDVLVKMPAGVQTLGALLPGAFGPDNLFGGAAR
jgi:cytidine deaminase